MNEEIDDIKILVARFITNQASEQEASIVKRWINSNPENEEYYIELYTIWQDSLSLHEGNLIDQDKAYALFLSKTVNKEEEIEIVKDAASVRFISWSRIAAAATIIMVFALGIYYFKSSGLAVAANEIVVPKGGIKKTVLKDGTIVWLNAGSTLKYADKFGETSRTVYLDGEAYFDIAESSKKIPFIVKTNRFTIRDIGTVFNVKAYSEDAMFETVVFTGEVSVEGKLTQGSNADQKVFLKKQQVLKINNEIVSKPLPSKVAAAVDKAPKTIEVLDINPTQADIYNGWKDDLLVFEGITFNEISKILERRYDVTILIKDKELRDFEYTGSFKNVEDIYKALNIIKETTPIINYEIKGSTITIWKNGVLNN